MTWARFIFQWRIQGRGPGGPGGPAAPLLLDQTEVRGAQKIVLGHRPPRYLRAAKGLDDRPLSLPPPPG